MGIKSASSSKIEQGLEVLYVNDYFGLGNCYMFTSEDSLLKTINILLNKYKAHKSINTVCGYSFLKEKTVLFCQKVAVFCSKNNSFSEKGTFSKIIYVCFRLRSSLSLSSMTGASKGSTHHCKCQAMTRRGEQITFLPSLDESLGFQPKSKIPRAPKRTDAFKHYLDSMFLNQERESAEW